MAGNDFLEISKLCPYCTTPTDTKKETILQVSKEFDAKAIEHLNTILQVLENLKQYFTKETNERLCAISKNINGLSKEEIEYLIQIKTQIDTLKNKLTDLKGLTFFSFKDVDKAVDVFNNLKIKIEYLTDLNSEETIEVIRKINDSLDSVLSKIGILQGEINKQKITIQKTIEDHNKEINHFLKFAGYKYFVDVEFKDNRYKMRLNHQDYSQSVSNGTQHLSYGEKNAFSLILFMYECLSKNPDLIILDDPISSFDRNKKYAVIDMLFRKKKSLKGKTVLMMTHDFEPIIDVLYNLPHKFEPLPYVTFLELKSGIINEIQITRNDIATFGNICEENILNQTEDVIKLIYLRRYYEIINNKGIEYQLLSNLLKKREKPFIKEAGNEIEMSILEINNATSEIKLKIPDFDYKTQLNMLSNDTYMANAYNNAAFNYEKLQIFRIINKNMSGDDIIDKFINETFHIENEYIMQLNPCKYEIVPQYIIDKCDSLLLQHVE
jgi:energy-coupling factor transporter ATP-binding protein EcfA2